MTMREEFEAWCKKNGYNPVELPWSLWQAAYRAGQKSAEAERDVAVSRLVLAESERDALREQATINLGQAFKAEAERDALQKVLNELVAIHNFPGGAHNVRNARMEKAWTEAIAARNGISKYHRTTTFVFRA